MIGPGQGTGSFDASGNALYSNQRTISSSDRTLINAFRTISEMCDRINLPRTITDRANALFKKVHDGKNLRGRSNDAISSGRISIKLKKMSSNHTISYEKKRVGKT